MLEHQPVRKELSLDFSSSKKFIIDKQNFAPQYAQLYFCRLCALRDQAMAAAHARWGKPTETFKYANRIVDIRAEEEGKQTAVVGVIFREMVAKPSILHQYNVVTNMLIPPPPNRSTTPYSSDSDKLVIEDENGRCTLDISQLSNRTRIFTTGIVLAVRGFESLESGCFVVTDVTSIGPPPQRPLAALPADAFVAFMSGIELGGGDMDGLLGIELLLEFLKGNVGDDNDASDSAAIVQLIVAGNLIAAPRQGEGVAACIRNTQRAVTDDQKMTVAEPIVEVDRFLTAAASVMPVAVMPGENDPVNYLMPQQAIHRCLLPSASRSSNVHRVTNPLSCEVEGRIVLGTSGQPVSDFILYGELPSANEEEHKRIEKSKNRGNGVLDVLETMLNSRHISPTCPDTLGSYPFSKDDPFVLTESPHILFAGNQTEFASRIYNIRTQSTGVKQEMQAEPAMKHDVQCRLVSVPKFRESGQIVLVNLRTLDCTVREFAMSV